MHLNRPLPLVIALIVLVLTGAVAWYVLSRPSPGLNLTPEETGTPGEAAHITETGTYYEIDAQYPSSAGLSGSADVAATALMKGYVEGEVARFKSDNQLTTMTPETAPPVPGLGEDRKYAFGTQYEMRMSPATVTYIFLIYEDTLGAHPNAYYKTFTFDLTTGEELGIDEFFAPGSNYLATLSKTSRDILYPQIATAENVSVSEVDGTMIDAGTTADIANFSNFYLDGPDLVIVFTPYQVGPWALGTQEARIPRTQLSGLLKASYQ